MKDTFSRPKRAVSIAIQLLALSCAVATVQGATWQVGLVDTTVGGKYSSLRIDQYGNAHIVSFDYPQWTIWYNFWDHKLNKWFSTPLDNGSGFCSMVLDSKQRPHISYPEYGTGKLRHVYWDGSSWIKETIRIRTRIISYYTSITLDSMD